MKRFLFLMDNSVLTFDINKIKSLEFMPEAEPGQIDGYWYLGWRVMSTSSKNMNGDENGFSMVRS